VVTSTLVFDAPGAVNEYVGGYSDWLRQRPAPIEAVPAPTRVASTPVQPATAPSAKEKKRKLSFKEAAELDALPDRITAAEVERDQCYRDLADPTVLRDGARVVALQSRVAELEASVLAMMERWEALESLR